MFKIGFVGMTHLGVVSSFVCGEKGNEVICFDPDANIIKNLQRKSLDINEPLLDKLLKKVEHSVSFTSNISNLNKCSIIYLS